MIGNTIIVLLIVTASTAFDRPRFDGRIIGGHEVDIKDYPWQVSLQSYGSHICGGSIISKTWVLTASHCVIGKNANTITLRAGSSTRGSGGYIHQASRIVMHPSYDDNTVDYDFALVEVKDPFQLGQIGVWLVSLTSAEPTPGTMVTVTGWGVTNSGGLSKQLQGVNVHIVDRSDCGTAYGGITSRMICAADYDKDACQGDSGGPLIDSYTGKLVGVVSFGEGCADPYYPGVYSNVAYVRDWIQNVSGV